MYKSSTSSQPRVFAMWAVCFIQKFELPLKSELKKNLFTQIPHSVNAPTVGCNVFKMTIDKTFEIKHVTSSFAKRMHKILTIYMFGIFASSILCLFTNSFDGFLFFAILLGVSLLYNLKQNSIYLADFSCDSNVVNIRFYRFWIEDTYQTTLDKVTIKLINTTSLHSGFKCELEIKLEDKKFIIDNQYDWDLKEMKRLFEFIQNHNGIPMTNSDKFNLRNIEEMTQ